MRHERRSRTISSLAEELDKMVSVVQRHRGQPRDAIENDQGRRLRESVTVMIWEEPDGSETVEIVGPPDAGILQMKGALHDGLYALAQEDSLVR